MESGVIVDKVVQVQDVDLTTPGNVIVACTLFMVFANHSHTTLATMKDNTNTTPTTSSTNNNNNFKRMRNDEI